MTRILLERVIVQLWSNISYALIRFELFLFTLMMFGTKASNRQRLQDIIAHNRVEFQEAVKLLMGDVMGLSNDCRYVDTRARHNKIDTWRFQYARAVFRVRRILDSRWKRLKDLNRRALHTKRMHTLRNSFLLNHAVSYYVTRYIHFNGGLIYVQGR